MTTQRPNRKLRNEIMRDEAKERQTAHDVLTPEQKLAKLDKRPGKSSRERKRLEPLVEPPAKKPARRRAKRVTAQSIREAQK